MSPRCFQQNYKLLQILEILVKRAETDWLLQAIKQLLKEIGYLIIIYSVVLELFSAAQCISHLTDQCGLFKYLVSNLQELKTF